MKRSGFQKKDPADIKPMKRKKIRVAGKSTTAQRKKEIQRLVREIVIKRDGGCILRDIRHCDSMP